MTLILPTLKHVASPNFSSRNGTTIDLLVLHDTQGGYEGSIGWFANSHSQVSAHLVLKEDGSEATMMVDWEEKAWHVVAFNSRSIGLEMAGFAKDGYGEAEWQAAANIIAWLCAKFKIPAQWAVAGHGPGIARHYDLGAAGGNHSDPTTDNVVWQAFIKRVQAAMPLAEPTQLWGLRKMGRLATAPVLPPLPDWPALDSPFGQAYFTRMAHLYNCLIKAGFHNPAAVGIIANADMESAIEPTAVGDEGNAFNIFQWWWAPRGMAILQGCGVDVRTETRMDQIVAALTWELAYPYATTFTAVSAATTGADAAGKFCDMFEGASAPGAHQRRQDDALRIETFLADNMTWVLAQGIGD
jgi:hypothetical protein